MDSQKCIWMDAGAVEYQLCPLKLNCDLCDFHKEMIRGCRTHSSRSVSTMLGIRCPDDSVVQFQPGLQYLEGHFWFKRIAAGRIQLGIDAFLWHLFSSFHRLLTPKNTPVLIQDQCFGWLLLEGGIIYLRTPIAGKVVAVNPFFLAEEIKDTHLYLAPEHELWIVELEVSTPNKFTSLSRDQYTSQAKEDCSKFENINRVQDDSELSTRFRYPRMDKREFSKYLLMISDNHAFIC